jgi:predicted acyltransferase (DUF342 family)
MASETRADLWPVTVELRVGRAVTIEAVAVALLESGREPVEIEQLSRLKSRASHG